jgi:hypothetical protein
MSHGSVYEILLKSTIFYIIIIEAYPKNLAIGNRECPKKWMLQSDVKNTWAISNETFFFFFFKSSLEMR